MLCYQELARNRLGIYSERERQRREMQEEEVTRECTFRPRIATAAAGATNDGDSDGGGGRTVPFHERLHREAREREAARALAQHHVEAQALRECTFQASSG